MIVLEAFNILILDHDKKFIEAFKYALDRDSLLLRNIKVVMFGFETESQLSLLNAELKFSYLLIDSSFVNVNTINYFNKMLKINPNCKIILLVSSQRGLKIKETIRLIDSLKVLEGIEFILGDNVSENMKVAQCLTFIKKGLK